MPETRLGPALLVTDDSAIAKALATGLAATERPLAWVRRGPVDGSLPGVLCLRADPADPADLAAAITVVQERWGPVGLLVHHARAVHDGPPGQLSAATLDQHLRHAVTGALVASHQVLPAMRRAGKGGLVFVGPGAAVGPASAAAWAATGVMARALAAELADTDIVVRRVEAELPEEIAAACLAGG